MNGVDPLGLFVFGGAGLATAAMGATGLLQHAPAINQWGLAVINDVMDGSPGVIDLVKDSGKAALEGVKSYPDIVDNNLAKKRKAQDSRLMNYKEMQYGKTEKQRD